MSTNEAFFVGRTLQALEILAFGPRSAPQVATALQVHPRTARRLLNRLATDGWLRRTDGPRPTYAPTMRIVALVAQLTDRAPVVRHGTEIAAELHSVTGLSVHLAVPSYRHSLRLLAMVNGGGSAARRDLAPAHASACGKLLLAFRDPWRESVLERPLEPVTAATVIDPDAVRAEAEQIRTRGLSFEREELRPGVHAIAAPVRDATGDVLAALAVSGSADAVEPVAAVLESAASALSERLAVPS
jgi:DNA-binding IclR family transcriptional regulator